ncbi:MAG: M1 family metallopeptidase [Bacteroidales bacterium]|nr:M1 family metallopeptidase [Bacteroidales bacterium]
MQKQVSGYNLRQFVLLFLVILLPFPDASSQDYFQQAVNYEISVTLNDRLHELNGFESVEYINNSPDTLGFLYFHLWPNAYSDNNTPLARQVFSMRGKQKLFRDPELRGYIDSLYFEADGNPVQWHLLPETPDICMLTLNKPLRPGDTVLLTTPFHVKIPKGVTSRLGHIGESYQITQWYPKPAVYDRDGWHQMPYLDQAEFYSEFGSFDVSITLPDNYVVGATGNLQNEEEREILERYSTDTLWTRTGYYRSNEYPPSSENMKTLRYTAGNVHDFAWFADKRFNVRKGTVKLPDKEVTTWVMFTDQEAYLWKDAISYVNSAIAYFSKWIGSYPYDNFTAVQSALNSGAGMEYPGLTVIGLAGDPYLLDQVLAHEISHNWFYSAIGSDERRYPFMDESIASSYESRYMEERYPGKKLWEIGFKNQKLARFFRIDEIPVQRMQEIEWLVPAGKNMEQPVNLPAVDYSYENYGSIVYYKAAKGFNYLRTYLGDSLFDTIMHDYYRSWAGRHPRPDDLRAAFESRTTEDTDWFFDDYLGTTKRLDYKIVRFKDQKLLIRNKGELNAPLIITVTTGDSVSSELREDGFEGKKWIDVTSGGNSVITIDLEQKMTEINRLDNNIRTSGLFPKANPFQLRFLYTIEEPDKRSLVYIPAFDWNSSDGIMAGLVLNNGTLLPKPVEYLFIPFYTFRNQGLTGYGRISFNIKPYNNLIRTASLTLEGEQFGAPGNQNYRRAKIGLDLGFRPHDLIDPLFHKVSGYWIAASDLRQIEELLPAKMRSFVQIGYNLERPGLINPFNLLVSSESGRSYHKASLDFNYTLSYYGRNKGFGIRFFAGAMLKDDASDPFYSFSASGRSGSEQYLYQGLYPDRFGKFSTSFWSRQMDLSEGGLVSPVNDALGYSRWLLSLSMTSSLPGKSDWIPLKPFVNILLNDHGAETARESPLFFEAGIKAGIWNFFEIYLPLIVSDNIESITGSFKERIRFVFRLDLLNPLKLK